MKITTDTGFTCEIDERVFDDFRTLSAMGEMFDAEAEPTQRMGAASRIISIVLGGEKKRLYKHLEKDGFVSAEDVYAELNSIMEKVTEAKAEVKKG